MLQANVTEAKANLSTYLQFLETGQQDCIVIARHGNSVAKLVPIDEGEPAQRIGVAKGKFSYSENWDSPEFNEEVGVMFEAELHKPGSLVWC
jgi:antitoxin (DNA-binding transcriptional repressor) of toxin-antitoxin stability system